MKHSTTLIFGLIAGAAIGILLAPDKGSVTRKKVRDCAKDLADKIKSNCSEEQSEDIFTDPTSQGATI
jgi:gas vesicle protein